MSGGLTLAAYRLAGRAIAPFAPVLLARRVRRGKEDPERLGERLGHPGVERPAGPVVWLHGASVGEALSLLPLIEALVDRWPAVTPLVTTGTLTAARVMAQRLPGPAVHQFVPVDLPAAVERFLGFWRPSLGIWVESELWPNALAGLHRRGVPAVLVNGRLSERSLRRWLRMRPLARRLLAAFSVVLAQSEADGARFRELGAIDVQMLGNLKFDAAALPADLRLLAELEETFGARPRWLAASTHDGEEAMVAEAHRRLAETHPDLLSIIVPRHPERGPAIAAALRARGVTVALRSRGEAPGPETGLYLADTVGELGLWYRLCGVVLVGGSLVAHGGHNPLEPARLDCALLMGPHMENFQALADGVVAAGGGEWIADPAALAPGVERLLAAPDEVRRRAEGAASFAGAQAGVLDAVLGALAPWLDRLV